MRKWINNRPIFMPNQSYRINNKIIIIVCFLCMVGCVMVYSASCYSAKNNYNNEYYFLIKQIIGVVLGFVCMLLVSKINYHKYTKLWQIILAVSFILLILVFIPGFGIENYGAKRWINLGLFTMQASEIAKFGFVIFCSVYLSSCKVNSNNFASYLPIIIVGVLMCVLIIMEPNMSITMCVGIVMLAMLYIGGIRKKYFILILIPAILVVPMLIIIEPYRLLRLFAFLNPWASPQGEGFQLIQSLYSLGAGGMFGVGLFNSRQAYQFLPFSESDFIFSIIGEEFGFLGAICLILVFAYLIYNIVLVARRSKDRLGTYLAFGIGVVLAAQVLINIAVVYHYLLFLQVAHLLLFL